MKNTTVFLLCILCFVAGFFMPGCEENKIVKPTVNTFTSDVLDSNIVRRTPVTTPQVKAINYPSKSNTAQVKNKRGSVLAKENESAEFGTNERVRLAAEQTGPVSPLVDSISFFEACYNDSTIVITAKGKIINGQVDSLGFTYQLTSKVYTRTIHTTDSIFMPPAQARGLFLLGGFGYVATKQSLSLGLFKMFPKYGYGFTVDPLLNEYKIWLALQLAK